MSTDMTATIKDEILAKKAEMTTAKETLTDSKKAAQAEAKAAKLAERELARQEREAKVKMEADEKAKAKAIRTAKLEADRKIKAESEAKRKAEAQAIRDAKKAENAALAAAKLGKAQAAISARANKISDLQNKISTFSTEVENINEASLRAAFATKENTVAADVADSVAKRTAGIEKTRNQIAKLTASLTKKENELTVFVGKRNDEATKRSAKFEAELASKLNSGSKRVELLNKMQTNLAKLTATQQKAIDSLNKRS